MNLHVFKDAESLAGATAERVVTLAGEAVLAHGWFDLALSGGRTPAALHRRLAGDGVRERVAWDRVRVWFADERAVPPNDPDSNFRMARETLLDAVGIAPRHVHRMKGEAPDLAVAVEEYDAHLPDRFDLMLLGIGEDGHTASIFPGSELVVERVRRVAAVLDSPKPPARRLTLTPRVIREARHVVVLASGADKSVAVARALAGPADIRELPARMLREYEWFVDAAAAAGLP